MLDLGNEYEAREIGRILVSAIKSNNSNIIAFCKIDLYPMFRRLSGDIYNDSYFKSENYKLIQSIFE